MASCKDEFGGESGSLRIEAGLIGCTGPHGRVLQRLSLRGQVEKRLGEGLLAVGQRQIERPDHPVIGFEKSVFKHTRDLAYREEETEGAQSTGAYLVASPRRVLTLEF